MNNNVQCFSVNGFVKEDILYELPPEYILSDIPIPDTLLCNNIDENGADIKQVIMDVTADYIDVQEEIVIEEVVEPEVDVSQVSTHIKTISEGLHPSLNHGIRFHNAIICDMCGEYFEDTLTFQLHAGIHEQKPQWNHECTICGCILHTRNSLLDHIKRNHADTDDIRNVCDICGEHFEDRRELQKHNVVHIHSELYLCSLCDKRFYSRSKLKRHIVQHQDIANVDEYIQARNEKKKTNCSREKCRKSKYFIIKDGSRVFPCFMCDKIFGTRSSQQIHLRIHTGERPYGCRFCLKAFADGGTLRKHERIHTGEKPYVCPICFRAFNQRVVLREHIRSHHVNGVQLKNCDSIKCDVCDVICATSNDLCSHLISHSDENTAKHRQRTISKSRKEYGQKNNRRRRNSNNNDDNNNNYYHSVCKKDQINCLKNFSAELSLTDYEEDLDLDRNKNKRIDGMIFDLQDEIVDIDVNSEIVVPFNDKITPKEYCNSSVSRSGNNKNINLININRAINKNNIKNDNINSINRLNGTSTKKYVNESKIVINDSINNNNNNSSNISNKKSSNHYIVIGKKTKYDDDIRYRIKNFNNNNKSNKRLIKIEKNGENVNNSNRGSSCSSSEVDDYDKFELKINDDNVEMKFVENYFDNGVSENSNCSTISSSNSDNYFTYFDKNVIDNRDNKKNEKERNIDFEVNNNVNSNNKITNDDFLADYFPLIEDTIGGFCDYNNIDSSRRGDIDSCNKNKIKFVQNIAKNTLYDNDVFVDYNIINQSTYDCRLDSILTDNEDDSLDLGLSIGAMVELKNDDVRI